MRSAQVSWLRRLSLLVDVAVVGAHCGSGRSSEAGLAVDTDDAFVLTQLGVVETLVRTDPNGQGALGLATGWQQIDPRAWRCTEP